MKQLKAKAQLLYMNLEFILEDMYFIDLLKEICVKLLVVLNSSCSKRNH